MAGSTGASADAPGHHPGAAGQPGVGVVKVRAAALSVASNTILILLKIVAGAITGSVAILTEAVHSSIDLIASLLAYLSLRKADAPADASHPYGHEKLENLAAASEGLLILVGAGVIVYESVRHLINGSRVHSLGFGIVVISISAVVNMGVSTFLGRRARSTRSPALEGDAAHLRTDAATSFAVLISLVAVQITGQGWLDPAVALAVAAAIVVAGVRILSRSSRVLVDEALPPRELQAIRETVLEFGPSRGVAGFHRLRARRAGARRHVDLHVQFRAGTTLEDAHRVAHQLQDAIAERLGDVDVLIHLEPEDRVRPDSEPSER
jgi:cation diffusion facilitator family transporter